MLDLLKAGQDSRDPQVGCALLTIAGLVGHSEIVFAIFSIGGDRYDMVDLDVMKSQVDFALADEANTTLPIEKTLL